MREPIQYTTRKITFTFFNDTQNENHVSPAFISTSRKFHSDELKSIDKNFLLFLKFSEIEFFLHLRSVFKIFFKCKENWANTFFQKCYHCKKYPNFIFFHPINNLN